MSELNKIAGTEVTFIVPDTESLGALDGMQPTISLNMRYRLQEDWEKIKGQPIKVYFLGIKVIPNPEGQAVNCGLFASSKEVFLAGGIILIDLVKDLQPKTPLQITYLGTRENNREPSKKALNFNIQRLG